MLGWNCSYCILSACFDIAIESRTLHTCYSNISPWLVFQSGDYFVQHIQRCGHNSRAVTNWERCLVERNGIHLPTYPPPTPTHPHTHTHTHTHVHVHMHTCKPITRTKPCMPDLVNIPTPTPTPSHPLTPQGQRSLERYTQVTGSSCGNIQEWSPETEQKRRTQNHN